MSRTIEPPTRIPFGPFEADLPSQELRKHGVRLRLPPQSFQILKMLLERRGEVVTREELRAKLWPSDTFVDFDHGLNAAVKRLRDALGDTAEDPRVENVSCRVGWLRICGFDSIAEFSELTDHLGGAPLFGLFGDCRAPFFVTNSLVEDHPDEETLPMCNHPDSLFMSKARYHTAIDNLKDSSFSLDCRVGSLIE